MVQEITGNNRNKQGKFLKGTTGNPSGRPRLTQEQKIFNKATKEIVEEYRYKLEETLLKIAPVLIKMALSGDIRAIKDIEDRVLGKPKENLELYRDTGPIQVSEESSAWAKKAIDEALELENSGICSFCGREKEKINQ